MSVRKGSAKLTMGLQICPPHGPEGGGSLWKRNSRTSCARAATESSCSGRAKGDGAATAHPSPSRASSRTFPPCATASRRARCCHPVEHGNAAGQACHPLRSTPDGCRPAVCRDRPCRRPCPMGRAHRGDLHGAAFPPATAAPCLRGDGPASAAWLCRADLRTATTAARHPALCLALTG